MNQSTYLEQTLFYNQSTETDKTLKERSNKIFEKVETNSFVEIHVPISENHVRIDSNSNSPSSFTPQMGQVKLDDESSNPPSPIDHCHYLGSGPPLYVEPRELHHLNVSSSQELRNIATVRLITKCEHFKLMTNFVCLFEASSSYFRIWFAESLPFIPSKFFIAKAIGSFIHQRHSHSRLHLTRELFEELMSAFGIFPRFKEFVLLFGAKRRENEIGPPRMRFRRLLANSAEPVHKRYTGFGECSSSQ